MYGVLLLPGSLSCIRNLLPKEVRKISFPAEITNDWVEKSNQLSVLLGEGTRLSRLSQVMAGDGSHPGPLQVSSCSASSQGGWQVFGVK